MDQNAFMEVKCSSLIKSDIGFEEKQNVVFEENEVKFDSLNKKMLFIVNCCLDLLKVESVMKRFRVLV